MAETGGEIQLGNVEVQGPGVGEGQGDNGLVSYLEDVSARGDFDTIGEIGNATPLPQELMGSTTDSGIGESDEGDSFAADGTVVDQNGTSPEVSDLDKAALDAGKAKTNDQEGIDAEERTNDSGDQKAVEGEGEDDNKDTGKPETTGSPDNSSGKGEVSDEDQAAEGEADSQRENEGRAAEGDKKPEEGQDPLAEARDQVQKAIEKGDQQELVQALTDFAQAWFKEKGLSGFTNPDQVKKALERAFDFLNPKGEARKEFRAQRELLKQINQLMALETRLLALPQVLEKIKEQYQGLKRQAEGFMSDPDFLSHRSADPKLSSKRLRYYQVLAQMTNLKAAYVQALFTREELSIKYADLMRQVKAKLGLYKGIGGMIARVLDWGSNRLKSAGVRTAEEVAFLNEDLI